MGLKETKAEPYAVPQQCKFPNCEHLSGYSDGLCEYHHRLSEIETGERDGWD